MRSRGGSLYNVLAINTDFGQLAFEGQVWMLLMISIPYNSSVSSSDELSRGLLMAQRFAVRELFDISQTEDLQEAGCGNVFDF